MSSETIRENVNETVREHNTSESNIGSIGAGSSFRDYEIVRQQPSTSTEADIFVVSKANTEYILKLYRYGIEPKKEILQSMKSLSETSSKNFIRIMEADYDSKSQRWFEIQEYARHGSLQAIIDDLPKYSKSQRMNLFNDVARQIGEALDILHKNNLLHLDIKPSNILLRTYKPLNLVLIDFGIATSLSSDMSKKFTQTRGTPMYQSPESYTGGMGRASDWWGLGMILLEIASGSHPFKGLSSNVIAYSVATEPVNVPETIDAGQRELIHGLLTRNPEKRWNWTQVSQWLNGKRNIPHYFEEAPESSAQVTVRPFTFMGQQCRSLEEIAAAFVKSEDAWDKGKAMLMRGNVRAWLEQNGEFERGEDLERDLSRESEPDFRMFRFTQLYGKDIPFIFCGKAMTLQNLLLFTGKAARKEKLTSSEQKIVNVISNHTLLDLLNNMPAQSKNKYQVFITVLSTLKNKPMAEFASFLNFYLNPQIFFCPFVKDASSPEKVINSSKGLTQSPKPINYFTEISSKYIIPRSLLNMAENAGTYHKALNELEKMKSKNHLILRKNVPASDEKRISSTTSMDEYMADMYKLQWGYDEASVKTIESSLQSYRSKVRYASGLGKAQMELWIAYLEVLAKKESSLSNEDKKLLQNVDVKATDQLAKRISELVR